MLDDPLSAVDVHVGKHIFENVISNYPGSLLAEKTRVWVTNNLSYLNSVDHIIVLENGEIVGQGPFQELIKSNSRLKELIEATKDISPTSNIEETKSTIESRDNS